MTETVKSNQKISKRLPFASKGSLVGGQGKRVKYVRNNIVDL